MVLLSWYAVDVGAAEVGVSTSYVACVHTLVMPTACCCGLLAGVAVP
jgi:hypothetical protein